MGAGILGLPGRVYALAGAATGWVVAGAAALALAAALCLAELGSRFDRSGGPVQYVGAAFGPHAGFAIGWLAWAGTELAGGSLLNLFADLLAPGARAWIILAAGAGLTATAMAGAGRSAAASTTLTALKLAMLAGVAIAGLLAPAAPAVPSAGAIHPAAALVALFFAFVGFERATAVAGEVADARRAAPFALGIGMVAAAALYAGLVVACVRGVPGLATDARPVGTLALRLFDGGVAGALDFAAAAIVLGTLTSQWITAPRMLLALAEAGQLPAALARVHPRRHTPDAAIAVTGATSVLLGLAGDFVSGVAASSAARLVIFAACAAALIRLRRRADASAARFRLPAGAAVATSVIVACAALLVAAADELGRLVILLLIGGALWLISNRWTARRPRWD